MNRVVSYLLVLVNHFNRCSSKKNTIMKKLYLLFTLTCFIGFAQSPGDIVITEIMQNPTGISDDYGEWFEVYNTTSAPIDLNGWTIRDQPSANQNLTIINTSVIVPAGGYITLGRGGVTDPNDPQYNGGVTHAYVYDFSFLMANGADEVILEVGGVIIDEVYYDGGPNFPDPNGASMTLDINSLNSTANDLGSNWCEGTSVYDATNNNAGTPAMVNDACAPSCQLTLNADSSSCDTNGPGATDDTYSITLDFSGGDVGTTFVVTATSGVVSGDNPSLMATGTIVVSGITEGTDVTITVDDTAGGGICSLSRSINSPVCIPATCANPGDIIITEILHDPAVVSDLVGEWFEVFNTTNTAIDIEGWILSDLGNNSHTIVSSGGVTVVPANGYLVLGRSTDMTVNGNAPVDYAWTVYTLSNTDDEIIITCGTTEIDRVEYTGTSPWPDPTGSSMELSTTAYNSIDNDLGSNWGVATSPFGDGDNGTPGAINDFTLSTSSFDTVNFKVYPNPVSGNEVFIKTNSDMEFDVVVYDILGKQFKSASLVNGQSLDVSGLNSGMYILKITQGNSVTSNKLIID